MELINPLILPNVSTFLDITTGDNSIDTSYEPLLKYMSSGKRIIFVTYIKALAKSKGGDVRYLRVSLSCMPDQP